MTLDARATSAASERPQRPGVALRATPRDALAQPMLPLAPAEVGGARSGPIDQAGG